MPYVFRFSRFSLMGVAGCLKILVRPCISTPNLGHFDQIRINEQTLKFYIAAFIAMRVLLLAAATFFLVGNIVNLSLVDLVESKSSTSNKKYGIWQYDVDGHVEDIACDQRSDIDCEPMQEEMCNFLKWSNALSTGFSISVFLIEVALIFVTEKNGALKEERPRFARFVFVSRVVWYIVAVVFLVSVCAVGQSIVDDDDCNMESGDTLKVSWAFWTAGTVFILVDVALVFLGVGGRIGGSSSDIDKLLSY